MMVRWALLGVGLLVSGCVAPPPPSFDVGAPDGRVVVAIVDIGINPYHVAFRAPGFVLPAVLQEAKPTMVDLTLDQPWAEAVDADATFWTMVERGELYWFRGTRVVAVSFADPALERTIVDHPRFPHGTGTAASVLARDPEAVIVLVDVGSTPRDAPPFFEPSYTVKGIQWALSQPWVDVVSLSLGMPGGAPIQDLEAVPPATRAGVVAGKVVVAGVGNDATPSTSNQVGGPPWVVKVGGVEPGQRGETLLASKGPDFVANFSVQAPCSDSVDASCDYLGTSFATPLVAGEFARSVRALREAVGHGGGIVGGALVEGGGVRVTNAALREAFNRSAVWWNTTEYEPGVPPLGDDVLEVPFRVAGPVGPGPWVQMGWGYVGSGLGEEVARRVLLGGLPERDAAGVAYMEALDSARWAYWER